MGLLMRNGIEYSGGGSDGDVNVYGAFLDPARVIYSAFTFDENPHDWVATEDCILTDNLIPPNQSNKACFVQIDGKQVQASYSPIDNPFVYVRKGQTVTYRAKSGSAMKAYAIQQGTNGIFAPVIYSDEERCIGVWRDNKPLYQKTIYYQGGTNGQISIPHGIANIEKVVSANGRSRDNYSSSVSYEMPLPRIATDNYNVGVSSVDGTNINFAVPSAFGSRIVDIYITLQYTKTTDVAGSGNWNTDGIPTHHYSTNEQVIGTWVDGKPLYEKLFTGLSISLNGENWVYYNDINYIDNVIKLDALVETDGAYLHCAISEYKRSNSNGIMLAGFNNFNRTINNLLVQYTKTTD